MKKSLEFIVKKNRLTMLRTAKLTSQCTGLNKDRSEPPPRLVDKNRIIIKNLKNKFDNPNVLVNNLAYQAKLLSEKIPHISVK